MKPNKNKPLPWESKDGALRGVIFNNTLKLDDRSQTLLRIENARMLGIRRR